MFSKTIATFVAALFRGNVVITKMLSMIIFISFFKTRKWTLCHVSLGIIMTLKVPMKS